MYLFFDTETTGLPKNWNAPVTYLNNWPRLVQLAYLLYDNSGNRIREGNFIIKPEGFVIPAESSDIHGVTTKKANSEGTNLLEVLHEFWQNLNQSEILIAHNISFDEKIIGAEFLRKELPDITQTKQKICTMIGTTDFCAIDNGYGHYKWPKLSELHLKLFNEEFEDAHNASTDIAITAKCFWRLKELGLFK